MRRRRPPGAREIDGFVSYHIEQVAEVDLVDHARPPRRVVHGPHDRRAAAVRAILVGLAAIAVASGQAESVIVFRARNRSKAASYGANPQPGRPAVGEGRAPAARRPPVAPPLRRRRAGARDGAHRPAAHARVRHAAEHFGMQAVAQRFHASRNPDAIMRAPSHARRLGAPRAHRRPDPARSTARSRTTVRPRSS